MSETMLRNLCGELEDMSVFLDTINIMNLRQRLEPAVEESESALRAANERIERLEGGLRSVIQAYHENVHTDRRIDWRECTEVMCRKVAAALETK